MLAPASRPELSKAALQQVIERSNGNAGKALSEHIAANTSLTADTVEPKVNAALANLPAGADSAAAADAAKQSITALIPKANLEFSEAVMLNGAVRPPAVAGSFYAGHPDQLWAEVAELLGSAPTSRAVSPKALIVPHAGYAYSGRVAAHALPFPRSKICVLMA